MFKSRLFKVLPPYEFAVAVLLIAILAALLYLALAGHLRTMVTGEALYDLKYPAAYPFRESVSQFFTDRVQARFLHGVLITGLFKTFGFNPPLYYFSVAALLVLAAAAIVLLLKPYIQNRVLLAALLVATLSVLPTLAPILVNLKKLHHALAWALFWWSCLLFYRWLISHHAFWLLGATLLFTGAWLSYEAIAFLLPVPVLLSAFELRSTRKFMLHFGVAVAIILVAYGASQGLLDLFKVAYRREIALSLAQVAAAPLRSVSAVLSYLISGDLAANFAFWPAALPIAKGFVLALVLFGLGTLVCGLASLREGRRQPEGLGFALAGLWLVFVTYIPFFLGGQRPDGDSLVGVGYGTVFLLLSLTLLLQEMGRPRAALLALLLGCAGLLSSGLASYSYQIADYRSTDEKFTNFVLSLKRQIPDVRDDTTFILVNTNWGRTGCLGYMEMLYPHRDTWCIHLLDGDTEEMYTQMENGQLVEDTGKVFQPGFVILQASEDGTVRVLGHITQVEFPLVPVEWASSQSIETDWARIESQPTTPSPFFAYFNSLP